MTLSRAQICPASGYLCHDMAGVNFQVRRWPLDKGKLKVRVPRPDFIQDAAFARELHEAAIEGIMAWDRQPFPITIDKRPYAPGADFGISWSEGAGGGVHTWVNEKGARLEYRIDGMAVRVWPEGQFSRDEVITLVRTTAAHEMGHALGLRHSDSERDVMFPQHPHGRWPAGPSARDLATVEALYELPNGAVLQ